jgi:hypothetical protein
MSFLCRFCLIFTCFSTGGFSRIGSGYLILVSGFENIMSALQTVT